MESIFLVDPHVENVPDTVGNQISEFREQIDTLESEINVPFIVMRDGKSGGYYIECHIEAKVALPLVDINAALDPEEQEDFRLERELRPTHKAFLQMCSDALNKRQFSDIVAEYDSSYRADIPLKILGGQHRTVAIEKALKEKKVSRYHGFKIYFGLSMQQRAEIAQVSNTNIQISLDLLDRMQETMIGPNLRDFCQKIGLLEKDQDFADRKNQEGIVTVRIARTFVVDFFEGMKNAGDFKRTFNPHICKSGSGVDKKYLEVVSDNKIWSHKGFIESGVNFSKLHKAQRQAIENDPDLRNYLEFKNKALSLALVSSWAFVSGLLQRFPERLGKLYTLPGYSSTSDPLAAKMMSESKHIYDDDTYRGLGARADKRDKGRLVQLFLEYSKLESKKGLTKELIDSAIKGYEAILANEEYEKSLKKVK